MSYRKHRGSSPSPPTGLPGCMLGCTDALMLHTCKLQTHCSHECHALQTWDDGTQIRCIVGVEANQDEPGEAPPPSSVVCRPSSLTKTRVPRHHIHQRPIASVPYSYSPCASLPMDPRNTMSVLAHLHPSSSSLGGPATALAAPQEILKLNSESYGLPFHHPQPALSDWSQPCYRSTPLSIAAQRGLQVK